jgi:putative membrane protein
MMWYDGGSMWFLGPLVMVLFWGGVIVLAALALRAFTGGARSTHDSSLEVLKRRLASGEISQDQYEQARKVLQG